MPPRAPVVLLLMGFGFQALCQMAQPATPSPKVPNNIVYEAFFRKVLFLQDLANKLDAQKKVAPLPAPPFRSPLVSQIRRRRL